MQLVDTNILAYLLIEGDRNEVAARFLKFDPEWHSETFVLSEFTNVLASCVRNRILSMDIAQDTLKQAYSIMGNNLHTMEHSKVLRIAQEYGTSAYDARYLALAIELGVKLTTEDVRLRRAAPKLTQSLDEALKSFES